MTGAAAAVLRHTLSDGGSKMVVSIVQLILLPGSNPYKLGHTFVTRRLQHATFLLSRGGLAKKVKNEASRWNPAILKTTDPQN
jgi:hypothetical protein